MMNPKESGRTEGQKDQRFSPPAVSLPKGGGAIRGIGEKFAANPVTGTGSMGVPIAVSPGRSGFGPQLSLSYDSGAGNGHFGLGWSLSLPAITRKTDKGLPQYRDEQESDVFLLSGAEDLVPVFKRDANGNWTSGPANNPSYDEIERDGFLVRRYRPRIEGLFARIERWTPKSDGNTYWRSISRDNITTFYGKTAESRIADPNDAARIFSWLICESYDDKGNAIRYEYKAENSQGIDLSLARESNRTDKTRSTNRYLKRIKYGNLTPRQPMEDLSRRSDWLFETVFDYGEHYTEDSATKSASVFLEDDQRPWPIRQDPFSTYRSGFEVRTERLCQRVLMFHHFQNELGTPDYLVRSTEFNYEQSPIASFISSVSQSGFLRQADGTYRKKSLPPIEFTYSAAMIQEEVREVDPDSLENLPYGLDGANYQWVDLDGEGLSGILSEQADGWFYKRNLSPLNAVRDDSNEHVEACFAPVELIASKPALPLAGEAQFLDLAGDGQPDLVAFEGPALGFYERTGDAGWESFRAFRSFPNLDIRNPNLKFIDLDGDGHSDILISEDQVFRWHSSLAEDGFGSSQMVRQASNEERGPKLVFADVTQSIFLADLSGDGLTDLVRIRNGEVCYWPNLGYGLFGAKVAMDNAPWFDYPDQFDQKRIRLADIDGSGTTDIIYLGANQVDIYRNQSGNGWSNRESLTNFPAVDNLAAVQAVDLLGNGTACLVWSSPLCGHVRRPMSYIDLMGGQKPHLLIKTINNLGAETVVSYAPSTRFYLHDKLAGRPWLTKLPFPVHVVERVETYDYISRNRFVTRYAYHHGYFDGREREFRGFGMVEQFDTELFTVFSRSDAFPDVTNMEEASHVPPAYTRTWFHTGAYLAGERISKQFEHEYYREDDPSLGESGLTDIQLEGMLLPDTTLPAGMTADEEREACRALKGSILRVETYAEDETEDSDRPYTISERNYTIEQLQPQGENRHAVFFACPRESIDFHYERKLYDIGGQQLADPRVTHSLTLKVDEFGNTLRSAAVGYGRRHADPDPLLTDEDRDKQKRTRVTFTENDVTNVVDEADIYRTPLLCESRTYELLKAAPDALVPGVTNLFGFERLNKIIDTVRDGAHDLPYEDWNTDEVALPAHRRRLTENIRTLYRNNDLTGPLPLGQVGSLGLPFESYKLSFTNQLLAQLYQRERSDGTVDDLLPDPASVLGGQGSDHGGYVDLDGNSQWWIPSGRSFCSRDPADTPAIELAEAQSHFYLPRRFQDAFGNNAFVDHDDYDLLLKATEDAKQNVASAQTDYRVLAPFRVTDPNGNRSEVAFDILGMVVGTAVRGKVTESKGDLLDDSFNPDLDDATILGHFADPLADPQAVLGKASTRLIYDLFAYQRTRDTPQPQPATVYALARETHHFDLSTDEETKIQHRFSYSDGFGREIQQKIQAEPGPLDLEVPNAPIINPRWVGSGWTIFNNKGKPVRKYEPFFDDTHRFQFGWRIGVSPIIFYDPVGRVVATLHPNKTWEKVVLDPWRQASYDVNDTVTFEPQADPDAGDVFRRLPDDDYLPTWHARRINGGLGPDEQQAAGKAAAHTDTPALAYFDTLGRTFLTVAHNRFPQNGNTIEEQYFTRVIFDIEGNQREVIDARGRIVMRYDYDMLSNRIRQASMEAGQRWMLNDVAGNPIRSWDSRGHVFSTEYDSLRRPVRAFVQGTDAGNSDPRTLNGKILFDQTEYGEAQPNDVGLNLRTRVFRQSDGAGIVSHLARNPDTNQDEAYDFKGNPLRMSRQFAQDYTRAPDWSVNPPLEKEIFTSSSNFDALNRPVTLTTPDNSVVRPGYNEANLLESMEVNLRGAATPTDFVTNIDYDVKGQRVMIEYGNNVRTAYEYDPQTFRLIGLKTTRAPARNDLAAQVFKDQTTVQDLRYTYDPAGNITRITDAAMITVFDNGEEIEPVCDYTYDALYRLIEASGREHIGQTAFNFNPPDGNFRDYPFAGSNAHPNDLQALRNYTERYEYDSVGNFEQLIHQATNGNWARGYAYNDASLIEPTAESNRLSSTTIGQSTETYIHDVHGNMTRMPHLPLMHWDYKDQLQATSQQTVNGGTPETTYYVYDAGGERVRKVAERQAGAGQSPVRIRERIYLGGFEIYREFSGSTATLERETLHIMNGGHRIAVVESKTRDVDAPANTLPNTLTRYQFDNHLGSACLELDDGGAMISYEEYYPYGSTSYQAGRSAAEVSLKRYRYTRKERDEETGLYYHGARYYAPWLGRWTSCDPLRTADGLELYVYARNNPLIFSDADGMQPTYESVGANTPPPVTELSRSPEDLLEESKPHSPQQERWAGESRDIPVSPEEVERWQARVGPLFPELKYSLNQVPQAPWDFQAKANSSSNPEPQPQLEGDADKPEGAVDTTKGFQDPLRFTPGTPFPQGNLGGGSSIDLGDVFNEKVVKGSKVPDPFGTSALALETRSPSGFGPPAGLKIPFDSEPLAKKLQPPRLLSLGRLAISGPTLGSELNVPGYTQGSFPIILPSAGMGVQLDYYLPGHISYWKDARFDPAITSDSPNKISFGIGEAGTTLYYGPYTSNFSFPGIKSDSDPQIKSGLLFKFGFSYQF
jgi:RHS repeat-associated protein